MKGLLIKDLKLLLGQKKFVLVVLGMGVFLSVVNENPISCVGYIIMLLTIFTTNTINYDEHNNGMAFLMTLPISRKTYVQEKYLFGGIIAVGAMLLSCIIAIISANVMNIPLDMIELIGTGIIIMFIAWIMMAISLPILIKFGAERGRMATIVGMGGAFFLALALASSTGAISFLAGLEPWVLVFGAVAAVILILGISYLICVRIINKKEY